MKALVTGAGGQLGRALLATAPVGWAVAGLLRDDCDLAYPADIRRAVRAHNPDLVVNAAAYTAVDRAEAEEDAAFAVNADAPRILAREAMEAGAHLVHVSTDFVFDGAQASPYRPGDARNPLSTYGRSKAAGEDAVGEAATVLRTAWVYAATGGNFVNTMLRLMQERDQIGVVVDQIGAPTWATGLAKVAWGLGVSRLSGVWHHSDAGVASWYDFAVAIQEEALALGLFDRAVPILPIATTQYPTPAHRPAFSLLDSSATRAALGTGPVHWRTNLRAMLAERAALQS